VYEGKGYRPESDVYSIAIMIWEFVARILGGEYEKPYSEYPHIKMEIQILIQACKLGLRPKIKVREEKRVRKGGGDRSSDVILAKHPSPIWKVDREMLGSGSTSETHDRSPVGRVGRN
jgi:hypothetical protein